MVVATVVAVTLFIVTNVDVTVVVYEVESTLVAVILVTITVVVISVVVAEIGFAVVAGSLCDNYQLIVVD